MPGDRSPSRLRTALLALTPALLAALFAACGGDALPWGDGAAVYGDGTWHGTMDTLDDGTVVVRNPEQGIWTEDEAWRIEEELRIGAATGEGPEVFGDVSALAVDSLGRIWVADGQAGELRVFGRDGLHVRTVGERGEGPGELSWPVGLEVTADGRVLLVDVGNQRYTVFDTAGGFVTDRHRPRPNVQAVPWRLGPVPSGRLADVGLESDARRDVGSGGHVRTPVRLDVLDADFAVKATHPFLPPRTGPFGPDRVWTVDARGYLWFGREDRYRIVQRRLAGDTVRVLERDVEPRPYSGDEREGMAARARRRMRALEAAAGDGDDGGVGGVDAADMPEHEPLIASLWVDGDGRLWVAPYSEPEPVVPGFDLFSPDGRHLGWVRSEVGLTPALPTPRVRGDEIYGVTVDSLDVPYVVRGRIVRPGSGG